MSRMYSDGNVILDLEYVAALHRTCRAGYWLIDVLLALGSEGQTFSLDYPTREACEQAFSAMRHRLEEDDHA